MKDGALKAMVGMGCLTVIYTGYLTAHVCSGQPIPDGPLLISMATGIGALSGGIAIADALKKR